MTASPEDSPQPESVRHHPNPVAARIPVDPSTIIAAVIMGIAVVARKKRSENTGSSGE